MTTKQKNSEMLDLAYSKGVKNPHFRTFFNGFPKEFFVFLRQGLKSFDAPYRTKAFKVSAELLEELDDQVEELAEKTGAEKGIVYALLFHSMEEMKEFSQVKNFCKEQQLAYGNTALEKVLSKNSERNMVRKGAKKGLPKGKRV